MIAKFFIAFIFITISLASFAAGKESAKAKNIPWGGYWWSMKSAEVVLGWESESRTIWSVDQIKIFDSCLTSKQEYCNVIMPAFTQENGKYLSPLMKFDLYIKRLVEQTYGSDAPEHLYAHASLKELSIHYIGNDKNHPHYNSAGFAGKCIGWALSTFDYKEPTQSKTLMDIKFEPADIKGLLATIYNGAQFFIPDDLVMGTEYRGQGKNSKAYKDVYPLDFIYALRATIGRGKLLEADLDPAEGVWNYPIFAYEMSWEEPKNNRVQIKIKIKFANDEVAIEDVFSNQSGRRKDFKTRSYTIEAKVPANWNGKIENAISAKWTGKSIHNHPDALILGMEDFWKETILDYADSEMEQEVNFEVFKSVDGFDLLVNELIDEYYQK